nr:ATP-dependent DNA helicase PIF1-like [Tanacetum cinerariifolium]
DEAPMINKLAYEAFERTFRDICCSDNVFGGKVVVFGGGFRQILPVILNGSRQDVVHASLNMSYLWKHCTILKLTQNMRHRVGCNLNDAEEINEFAEWILNIGEGKIGGIPNHKLVLKIGAPVMCLRNIDQRGGLCNGTRLQVIIMEVTNIEAKIISGGKVGTVFAIPHMNISPSDKKMPFQLNQRQYPIAVCFAMTINKIKVKRCLRALLSQVLAVLTTTHMALSLNILLLSQLERSLRQNFVLYHCLLYAKIHKIYRENRWTYLACKIYGRSAKEADSDESLSSGKRAKNQQFWNCMIHKGLTASLVHMRFKVIVRVIDETGSTSLLLFDDLVFKLTNGEQCHTLIQKHGPNYDDYFPPELNVLDAENVLHTPVLGTANSSRFINVASIPFNIEESLISADGTAKGSGTNRTGEGSSRGTENDGENSGSGKRTIINLDDFDEEATISKTLKQVIQVKLEPKD